MFYDFFEWIVHQIVLAWIEATSYFRSLILEKHVKRSMQIEPLMLIILNVGIGGYRSHPCFWSLLNDPEWICDDAFGWIILNSKKLN